MRFNFSRIGQRVIDDLFVGLAAGLRRLTFADNFESFEVTVTIANGDEVAIPNQLKRLPTRYLIVNQVNSGEVVRGTADWSNDFVYLRNNYGSGSTTVTVVFLA